LQQFATSEGYSYELAQNFSTAEEKIMIYDYDCVILDINLPDGSGFDILLKLQQQKRPVSVIVLSARDSLDDKIKGLELGADDYLTKPFYYSELIYASSIILLITYVGRFGFISTRIIGNGIKQIPVSLEEAARIIGIPPEKRFFSISIPLLLPSLFTAFVLSFVLCLGELGTTIMIYPPGTELMPVKIFTIAANAPLALTSSMTLISFGVTMFFILVFFLTGKVIFIKFKNE